VTFSKLVATDVNISKWTSENETKTYTVFIIINNSDIFNHRVYGIGTAQFPICVLTCERRILGSDFSCLETSSKLQAKSPCSRCFTSHNNEPHLDLAGNSQDRQPSFFRDPILSQDTGHREIDTM
jgi:hypothetical protein